MEKCEVGNFLAIPIITLFRHILTFQHFPTLGLFDFGGHFRAAANEPQDFRGSVPAPRGLGLSDCEVESHSENTSDERVRDHAKKLSKMVFRVHPSVGRKPEVRVSTCYSTIYGNISQQRASKSSKCAEVLPSCE